MTRKSHRRRTWTSWLCACCAGLLSHLPVTAPGQTSPHLTVRLLPAGEAPAAALAEWQRMLNPDGRWSILELSAQAQEGSLALPEGRVAWAGLFPEPLSARSSGGVQVVGDLGGPAAAIREVTALQQPSAPLPAPMGLNLAAHMDWVPFGIEERVMAAEAGSNQGGWVVKAGKSPAGIYGAMPWRLPRLPGSSTWQVEITLSGAGRVEVGLSDDQGQGFAPPEVLIETALASDEQGFCHWVPARMQDAQALRLTLAATQGGDGEIQVRSVVFQPVLTPQDAPARWDGRLGVWDWTARPERWMELRPLWKKAGISVLQLALPHGEPDAACLETLRQLRTEGFEVVAVEGDPHMVLPGVQASVLERHRQLSTWHPGALDAVQYDVEPYLLPGFRLQSGRWHENWAQLFESLPAADLAPVEAVVPFWLLHQEEGKKVLEVMAGSTRRVVTMNYRSDPVEAAAWGVAWLEWSAKHQRPVSLAIECGPISDSRSFTFRKAEAGRLWICPWPGQGTAVVLFETDVQASTPAVALAQVRETVISGSRTTLKDQPPEKICQMVELLEGTARQMRLPEALRPTLLLHEPDEAVLEHLSRRAASR
ncbi:MAG: hypothetical protein Q8M07_16850 [Prosthecobacter sp.]|nr:hypothetical protein [Prosthecobacter sp.]